METIILRNLSTQARIGVDWWGRDKPQPLMISIFVTVNEASRASVTDTVDDLGVNYSKLGKDVMEFVEDITKEWKSTVTLARDLVGVISGSTNAKLGEVKIIIDAPKQLLCTDGLEVEMTKSKRGDRYLISIKNIQANLILGVNEHERLQKQRVSFTIILEFSEAFIASANCLNSGLVIDVLDVRSLLSS